MPNRSAEEKNARNSVPWNKIISKRSEVRSEPIRGRENNTELRSMEQKYKQTLGILFRTIPWKRQQLGIPFQSMSRTKTCCQFCLLEQDFCKTNFCSCYFLSFRGIDFSVNFGMPWNEHFLPRNNESCCELFRGTFSERNSAANPNYE